MKTTPPPLLAVENLRLSYRRDGHWHQVVNGVSFTLQAGEMLALAGESGCGKTTTAQAIIGLLAANCRRDSGQIRLNGVDISGWSASRMDALRGLRISLVPQDPGNSLDPVQTIGHQVAEILRQHTRLNRRQRQQRVLELLTRVGLRYPEQRSRQYPHQLSGGMKQRVLIAIALALEPDIIIADEPTSALDVTVQRRILDLLDSLRRESQTAVLFITHDLVLAAERADRIMVFRQGKVLEQGTPAQLIRAPQHAWTRQLLKDAMPASPARPLPPQPPADAAPAIVVNALSKRFALAKGQSLQALNQVSFSVVRGTTHAIVGESGSGKSTLARILLGFESADSGSIMLNGKRITALRGEALRQARRQIQFVAQNPFASLDPRHSLYRIIEEPLLNFERMSRSERYQRVRNIAQRVALPPELLARLPRELSGGQRQRVALARALILRPQILVLDEATSALDVTVQAQILALLSDLQQELQLTCLFITHNLATVRQIAHSVTVLHHGDVIETSDTATLFNAPREACTRALIAAIPGFTPEFKESA